jgi:predicted transcriptional regulator
MEPPYLTLRAIYDTVKDEASPTAYPCTPHDLILRQSTDWENIIESLEALEKKNLVRIVQLDKPAIMITTEGIDFIKGLKDSFTIV